MANEACGCIYVIDCFDTEDLYIGSTCNFESRKKQHKSNCSNDKCKAYNFKLYKTIREYGGWKNWAMFPIEEQIPLEELKEREQFYIDTLEPSLNERYAIKDKELAAQRAIIYKKNYMPNYYQKNREEINKRKSEKIECECGEYYTHNHRARHMKTEKHMKLMENKHPVKVI